MKLSNKSVLINWVAILNGFVFRQRISKVGKGENGHIWEKRNSEKVSSSSDFKGVCKTSKYVSIYATLDTWYI